MSSNMVIDVITNRYFGQFLGNGKFYLHIFEMLFFYQIKSTAKQPYQN